MIVLCSILSALLMHSPSQDEKKLMIMGMNSNYILIDSRVMQVGDTFDEGANVWWCFKGQTMDVMDINTSKMYKFAAVKPSAGSASLGNFWQIEKPLSTNDQDSVDGVADVPSYFYVLYKQGTEEKKEVLNLRTDMGTLPITLHLYYYDSEADREKFITNDFRGFHRSLIKADKMAKEEMEKVVYGQDEVQKAINDYMVLMHKYTPACFKDIKYTYSELKLLLKL